MVDESKNNAKEKRFSPFDLAVEALGSLKEREAEIMRLRLGLTQEGRRLTLEEIGRGFGITRERVRQLEEEAVRHLIQKPTRTLKQFLGEFRAFMREKGGVISLMDAWSFFRQAGQEPPLLEESSLRLLLRIDPEVASLKALAGADEGFYLPAVISLDKIQEWITQIKGVLEREKTPLTSAEIAKRVGSKEEIIIALLKVVGIFGSTRDGRFGLREWSEISPRRIRDKIYLVLKEAGRPLHFKKIAESISDAGLSKKPVLARTVHNELIYDKRFVLVGRGIYALSEWGFKPGVVADVIKGILKRAGRPLKVSEIVEEVLKERQVKRNTIVANLQNRTLFKRVGKAMYGLAELSSEMAK